MEKIFRSKKMFVQKDFCYKKMWPKRFRIKKNIQRIFGKKSFFGPKNIWVKKGNIFGPKNFWSKNILVKKSVVQKNVGPQKSRNPKMGPKILVKIGSLTAEVILLWTNVAWTNGTLTV